MSDRAKTVLVVAYYFPPIAASGSMRPLGFCRYLPEYGWNPRVLTTSLDSLPAPQQQGDEGLWKMVPAHVAVDAVPHRNSLLTLIRFRDRLRDRIVKRFAGREVDRQRTVLARPVKHGNGGGRVAQVKDLILDWAFAFPDRQCQWYGPAVRRLSGLRRDERPDVVFATGSPWTGLLVGRRLAERFQVPFVADFRDPWTTNPFDGERSVPWLTKRSKQLERDVCEAASSVIVNTEELREELCAAHPGIQGKCLTITNGFDDDVVVASGVRAASGRSSVSMRPRIELSHFGSVYGERNPRCLLRATTELLREGRIRAHDLRLRFVGAWDLVDEECESLARDLERHALVRREPPMPRERCLEEMSRSDCLLALQGRYPVQIPAKVYEYLATGRPVLVIGGEGATTRLLRDDRLGTCWPNQVAILKDRLEAVVAGRTIIEAPRPNSVGRFHYRALTGRLAGVLNSVAAL